MNHLRTAISAMCVISIHLGLISSARAGTYSLNNDWSTSANPNGVWSYNEGSTPLTTQQFNWGGSLTGSLAWTTPASGTIPPAWTKSTALYAAAYDMPANEVYVHSTNLAQQSSSTLANVTWTSPDNETISISGEAWDGYFQTLGRDASWQLLVNGVVYAQRSSIAGLLQSNSNASLDQNLAPSKSLMNIPVVTGQVVMFEVTTTSSSSNPFGSWMGVELNINAPVPLPSAAWSGLSLLACLLGFKLMKGTRQLA